MTVSKLLFYGKTAVITGGGGGLGKSYALELSKRGASIVINDVPATVSGHSPGEDLVRYINENGGRAIGSYKDVTQGKDIVEDAIKSFGKIDILINNAGILKDKSFHKLSKSEWYDVLNIHLNGTFEMCHSVWPYMQQEKYGRIINIGSGAGLYGNFGQSNYSSAKMGILGLTNTLAIEGLKYNINVNCVIPVAASKMTESVLPPDLLKLLKPEHISPLVTYLSHDRSKETGGIYELGAGWYSKIRLERSFGVALGGKDTIASPEDIERHIANISDFTQSTRPMSLADSLSEMIEPRVPNHSATTLQIETRNSNGVYKSDRVLQLLEDFFTRDHDK